MTAVVALLLILSATEIPPSDDQLDDLVLDVVSKLELALDNDDVASAFDLLAPEWVVVGLPGSVQPIVPGADETAALQFYVETVAIDLTACEAESAEPPITHLVRCGAVVEGDLPAALGYPRFFEVTMGVDDNEIVSVFGRSDRNDALSNGYCVWAGVEHAEVAAAAFDISCHPVGDPTAHNLLASLYVEAGRPTPLAADLEARMSVGLVLGIESFQHRPATLVSIFADDWRLVRYPGLVPASLRAPHPAVSEYLAWSDVAYEVELGACEIAARLPSGGFGVECPEARWGGSLVANLNLEPVHQPIGFFTESGVITGVMGTTSPVLDDAVADLCVWAQANSARQGTAAFREDCAPHYTPAGAREIVALAAAYSSQTTG